MSKRITKAAAVILALAMIFTALPFTAAAAPAKAAPAAADSANAPVVLKVSEEVKPGGIISVYGENLSADLDTRLYLAEEGNRELEILQYDPEGHVLRAALPDDVAAGAYTLDIQNTNGGAVAYINRAVPAWISEKAAYAGMRLKLMGRNLDAAMFGGTTGTKIRLVPAGGGAAIEDVTVDSVTPYDVTFTMPSAGMIENSEYYVEVNSNTGGAAVGSCWVRLSEDGTDARLTYTGQAPADPLALSLGVSWSKDFNWSQVKDVKADFGAKGDGQTNDLQAIQSGIDWLASNGGGVLYFPYGTYVYNGTIRNKTGVILNGQDRNTTVLRHVGPSGTGISGLRQSLMGVANLKLTLNESDIANDDGFMFFNDYGDPWATSEQDLASDRMFFYNVWTDNSLNSNKVHLHYLIGGKENVLWSGCRLYGRAAVIYSVWLRQYVTVKNCTFDYSLYFNNFSASKALFLDNTITGHYVSGVSESSVGIHGFCNNPAQGWPLKDLYFDNNTISYMGQGDKTGNCDGEMIQCEPPAAQLMMGPVTAADAGSVTLTMSYLLDMDWSQSWQALIVQGKGLGQLRNVTGLTDNGDNTATAAIDRAWDVVPDSTSKVVIRRMVDDMVVTRTQGSNSTWGIVFYNVAYNGVIADNILSQTQGAQAVGYVNPDNLCSPTYFNQIKRNISQGKSTGPSQFARQGAESTWIGSPIEELDFFGPGSDYYCISNYATEIRDNTVNRYDCNGVADWATWKYACCIPLNNRNYDSSLPTTGIGTLGALIEGNRMMNSNYGIFLGKCAGTTFINGNVYRNISIDYIVDDGSANTVVYRDESQGGVTPPDEGTVPVIIKASEGVAPGDIISLYGEYMTDDVKVRFNETGTAVTPVQQDPEGQFVRVVMPDIAPGAYTLQVSKDGGATWSAKVYLNAADPRWLSDVKGYPGMQMKLIGRNLDAGEYGGATNTAVRLAPAGGGSNVPVTPDIVTPSAVTFTIPAGTASGDYYVEVNANSAGYGQNWIRHGEMLTVTDAPADPLALALGVGWADAFAWSNVHNVKTEFGAAGDGSADDTAKIQAAIDSVSSSGGGIVYFPVGTYNYTHFAMNGGVILKGEDRDNTTLNYVGTGTSTYITTKGTGRTVGNMGIANLRFTVDMSKVGTNRAKFLELGNGWPDGYWRDYGNVTCENIFLYNVFTDTPLDKNIDGTIMVGSRNRALIANSHFVNTPFFCAFLVDHAVFRDNLVELSHNCVELNGSKLIAENNTIKGYRDLPSSGDLHGFFINPAFGYYIEGAYYYNNNVSGLGDIGYRNNGEAFCMDGNGSFMEGHVTAAAESSVTFTEDSESVSGHDWTVEKFWACVVKGKGLGQLVKIDSYVDNGGGSYTLNLAEPWAVTPDATSVVGVLRIVNNAVYERNTINDCSTGIQSWMSAYDVLIADNDITNTNSHWHCGRILGPTHPSASGAEPIMFITTKRTVTSGAAANFLGNNWIGISSEQTDLGQDAYITTAYGNEFRDNSIDRTGFPGKADSYSTVAAAMPLVYNSGGISTGRGILATLIAGNTMINSDNGVWIASGVDGTLVYGNSFTGITNETIHDGGTNTVEANNSNNTPPLPPLPDLLIQAEDFDSTGGVPYGGVDENTGQWYIRPMNDGGWVCYNNIDLKTGYSKLTMRYSSLASAGQFEFRLDSLDGPLIGTMDAAYTGDEGVYTETTIRLTGANGVHSVYILFKNTGGQADWIKFETDTKYIPPQPPLETMLIQAEDFTSTGGRYGGVGVENGDHITPMNDGDWVCFANVDLKTGYDKFRMRYSSNVTWGQYQIRLDSPDGPIIGTVQGAYTGGLDIYTVSEIPIERATGVHDIYICFISTNGKLDWIQFSTDTVLEELENVALGKTITGSAGGSLGVINDGVVDPDNYTGFGNGAQWLVIDLGRSYEVRKINLWHFFGDDRTYHDVVVQLSNDPSFGSGVVTVFNNDLNNTLGQGVGTDMEYPESAGGKTITVDSVNARYVRVWSNGSTASESNHYSEIEVWAPPQNAGETLENLALGKTITGSAAANYGVINDGVVDPDNYTGFGNGAQWLVIDLERISEVSKIKLWHFFGDDRIYHDVIVQLSNDPGFNSGVVTVFNSDADNTLGQGAGTDAEYPESSAGKTITFDPIKARYVRVWSNGSTASASNHYSEIEVWGIAGEAGVDLSSLTALLEDAQAKYDSQIYTVTTSDILYAAVEAGRVVVANQGPTESDVARAMDGLQAALAGLIKAEFTCAVKSMLAKIAKPQAIPYEWNGFGTPVFTTSNAAVCGVTADGILKPVKAGIAVITAVAPNGAKTVFAVTVSA